MEKLKRNREAIKELVSPEKHELLELEKTGEYVFHGTDAHTDVLEPRQAKDIERGLDGEPGVHASPKAEYAIFMAIASKLGTSESSWTMASATTDGNGNVDFEFGVTPDIYGRLNDDASGIVYVLERSQFEVKAEGIEYVSHEDVVPHKKIVVHGRDLPKNIKILSPR